MVWCPAGRLRAVFFFPLLILLPSIHSRACALRLLYHAMQVEAPKLFTYLCFFVPMIAHSAEYIPPKLEASIYLCYAMDRAGEVKAQFFCQNLGLRVV